MTEIINFGIICHSNEGKVQKRIVPKARLIQKQLSAVAKYRTNMYNGRVAQLVVPPPPPCSILAQCSEKEIMI